MATTRCSSTVPASPENPAVEIKYSIEESDIEWEMSWTPREQYPDKPEKELIFEAAPALAMLLLNEVVFLNNHWWKQEWPEEARESSSLNVNCNDIFAWACADAEEMPYSEIENVYRYWHKDPVWGAAIWCIKRRNQMPQKPVEKAIRDAGIWNLDELGIGPNTQDAETQAVFAAYAAQNRATATASGTPGDPSPNNNVAATPAGKGEP